MTRLKKIIVCAAAALSLSAVGVSAFAANSGTSDYNDYYFEFLVPDRFGVGTSELREKQDDYDYARIHVKSAPFTSNIPGYFSLLDENGNTATSSITCTKSPDDIDLYYKSSIPHNINDKFRIEGRSAYSGFKVSGYWNP